jgi:outer membrane protein assembly factor BamB
LLGSLVNAQNPWLYENSYYGFQILEAYDGGTLILANADGQTNEPKLFKISRTGDLVWEHSFEANVSTLPLCMAEDSQGNIIIGGKTYHYQWDYADGFLLKLNPCGELLWFRTLQEDYIGNFVLAMVLDKNDNIIIVEYNGDINNWEYYEDTTLKKYNPDGQLLWSSVLLPESESIPQRVITCSDGGYLVEGGAYAPPPTIIRVLICITYGRVW